MKINFKFKNGVISLYKKLNNNETYKIKENKGIFFLYIFKKPQIVRGVTSYCEDGKHILMIDYDNICRWIVEKELEDLSNLISCPFYLFKTQEEIKNSELIGSYHGICLAKFPAWKIYEFQREHTSCDLSYTSMPLRNVYRSWVLRLSDKRGSNSPSFEKIIGKTENITVEISEAHLKLLNVLYKSPPINYTKKDKLTKLHFNTYETRN